MKSFQFLQKEMLIRGDNCHFMVFLAVLRLKCFSNEEQTTLRQVRRMEDVICDAGSFAIPQTLNHTSRRDWTHVSHVGIYRFNAEYRIILFVEYLYHTISLFYVAKWLIFHDHRRDKADLRSP